MKDKGGTSCPRRCLVRKSKAKERELGRSLIVTSLSVFVVEYFQYLDFRSEESARGIIDVSLERFPFLLLYFSTAVLFDIDGRFDLML